jgi:hypothetical protein
VQHAGAAGVSGECCDLGEHCVAGHGVLGRCRPAF